MKKLLLILGMITCIFGTTACGAKADDQAENQKITEDDAIAYADQLIGNISMIVQNHMEDQYAADAVIASAFDSWKSAAEDMGSYQSIKGHDVAISDDSVVINVDISGTKRDAKVEIILDENLQLTGITTNVQYSMKELMEKAGLNTLLGMGTVFTILILISLIISCFTFIPRIQEKFQKADVKETKKEDVKKEAVDQAIAQIIEKEELSDDLELVAVISAAIAASEGAVHTDGFVVRSIKRANTNKWQKA